MQPSLRCSNSWTWLLFGPGHFLDPSFWTCMFGLWHRSRPCCCGVVEEGCARNPYLQHTASQRVALSYRPGDNRLVFSPGLFLAQKNISPCWLAPVQCGTPYTGTAPCSLTNTLTRSLSQPTNSQSYSHAQTHIPLSQVALLHTQIHIYLSHFHTHPPADTKSHKVPVTHTHTSSHVVSTPQVLTPPLAHTHTNSHFPYTHTVSRTHLFTHFLFIHHRLHSLPLPRPQPRRWRPPAARAAAAALFGLEARTALFQHKIKSFPSKYQALSHFNSCRFPPVNHKSYLEGGFTSEPQSPEVKPKHAAFKGIHGLGTEVWGQHNANCSFRASLFSFPAKIQNPECPESLPCRCRTWRSRKTARWWHCPSDRRCFQCRTWKGESKRGETRGVTRAEHENVLIT